MSVLSNFYCSQCDFFFIVTVKELLSTYPSIIQDRRREENLIFIDMAEEDGYHFVHYLEFWKSLYY